AGFIGSPRMNFLKGTARQPGSLELDHGASLPLAELRQPAGEVVLGVRPDGFAVGDGATAPVRGKVVLNEYLGRESYLHLELEAGGRVVVEVAPDNPVRLDEIVGLELKPRAAHLFDAASEQRLAA
ncbi:MAG: ABC transporter ATP-binding protein, partial [Geminicoccaceae bacterium]|nr:ABC transporter ATP-binding protein [Geminicoccaceae bacterium]